MPEIKEIQHRVNRLFGSLPGSATSRITSRAALKPVIGSVDTPQAKFFSEFIDEHIEEATNLAAQFMQLANETPGNDGLEKVADQVEIEKERRAVGLVEHALMLFILHHPEGRKLSIPSLLIRSPGQAFASSALKMGAPKPGAVYARSLQSGSSPPEQRLDWFREDPLANEHHEHWHVVYPTRGIPNPKDPNTRRLKDRHGELFLYMHQQMLARYDAERIAAGLGLVVPYSDYRQPISEGYDPGGLVTPGSTPESFIEYTARPGGTYLRDLTVNDPGIAYTIHEHELIRDRTLDAIDSGYFRNGNKFVEIPQTHRGSELIGNTSEPTIDTVSNQFYKNHHGFGHILIAYAIPDKQESGVMANTATAIRDPIFWRWHRHIDDMGFRHQERLDPHNYDDRPPVSMRTKGTESTDLILCRLEDLKAICDPEREGAAIGQHAFGNAGGNTNWNNDFTSGVSNFTYKGVEHQLEAIAELQTEMKLGKFTLQNEQTVGFPYLDHVPYCYFIRLKNESAEDKNVTVRLFLAPSTVVDADSGEIENPLQDEHINNRRLWIEMDKFQYDLKPNEEAVVFRQDQESSVIRRPVMSPNEVRDLEPGDDPEDNYCECGWPYHLLVPRGTATGMYFRLFAMITDGEIDSVPGPEHCGSMSFCGARDEYPDQRPMGYPFDRRFSGGNFEETFAEEPNASSRRILIRCVNL